MLGVLNDTVELKLDWCDDDSVLCLIIIYVE